MRRKKRIGTCLGFLTICLCLLSACGKDEVYQPEADVDGYVYIAQKLQAIDKLMGDMLEGDMKVEGDYLYYARYGEKGTEVCRIPLSSISADSEVQESPKAESLRTFRYSKTAIPDYIAEQLPSRVLADSDDGKQSMWIETDDGDMMDISQIHCVFSFQDYDVDADGNIYCWQNVSAGKDFDLAPIGGTLSKWNCNGEKLYQVYFPDMQAFTLFGEENACILGEGRILLLDGEGTRKGELSTEQYRGDGKSVNERLFRDREGHVYYTLYNNGIKWGFQVLEDDGLKLKEMKGNFYEAVGAGIYTSWEGKMIPMSYYGDILQEYDVENDSVKAVLSWTNSGFLSQYVQSLVQIAPGELLVYYNDYYSSEGGIYLLSQTPVEDLPEKETLVMFSYEPTELLRKAVLQFNKENDTYRIIIDSYGADFSWRTMEGDAPLVDLAVVSQTPPDMLDMTYLDVHKYAEKGVLEDLAPYLERSSILNREDFLENALEGMTIDGCLTCIPNQFYGEWLMGRKTQIGILERWSMEDVYALSERYPESAHQLICDYFGTIEERNYLLNTFCAYYCLEEFIDWTNKECRFDSEEFVRLIKWVQEYAEGNPDLADNQSKQGLSVIPEEALLFYDKSFIYESMSSIGVLCGDETVLMGYPSADGAGVYPVYLRDALAITANSKHKEGAWEFLEYFLSTADTSNSWFSPKKELIYKGIEDAALQEYIPDEYILREGTDRRIANGWVNVEGEMVPYYAISQEQAEAVRSAIESAKFIPLSYKEKMILRIISEEAESYYNGDKSIEEVIRIIQNRVGLIMQE